MGALRPCEPSAFSAISGTDMARAVPLQPLSCVQSARHPLKPLSGLRSQASRICNSGSDAGQACSLLASVEHPRQFALEPDGTNHCGMVFMLGAASKDRPKLKELLITQMTHGGCKAPSTIPRQGKVVIRHFLKIAVMPRVIPASRLFWRGWIRRRPWRTSAASSMPPRPVPCSGGTSFF